MKHGHSFIKEQENRLTAKPQGKAARFWHKIRSVQRRNLKLLIALLAAIGIAAAGIYLYQNRQIRFDDYQSVTDNNLGLYRIEVPKKMMNIYESSGIKEDDFGQQIEFSLYYKDPFSDFQVFIFEEDVTEYPTFSSPDDYMRSTCNNLKSAGQKNIRVSDSRFNGQPAKRLEYTDGQQRYYRKLIFPQKDGDNLHYIHICVVSDLAGYRRYKDTAERIFRSVHSTDE